MSGETRRKVIDFMGRRRLFFTLSLVVTLVGVVAVALEPVGRVFDPKFTAPVGINWGIDFSPGTVIHLGYEESPDIAKINQVLKTFSADTGIKYRQAQEAEAPGGKKGKTLHGVNLRLGFLTKAQSDRLLKALEDTGQFTVLQKDSVGPIVGQSLMRRAAWAVFWASLLIFFYVWWKYEPAFSIGALTALFHDVFVMITGMALFGFEVNSPFVAAMLVVIGYSVNDTIVIFDRIRENARLMRRVTAEEVFNISVNQVLGRSITTVSTVIIVLITITIFGGASLRDFSGSLLVGVTTGAYSSICIASAIALNLSRHKRFQGKISVQLAQTPGRLRQPTGAAGESLTEHDQALLEEAGEQSHRVRTAPTSPQSNPRQRRR